ncbi:MAG TPA: beta-hexosaminidase [Ruminococcaceae bacterium]|nr:beta-hexosaminidase [Oscillospiraceae bacterium]
MYLKNFLRGFAHAAPGGTIMADGGTGGPGKIKKAAVALVLFIFIFAAAFGVYRVAGMILENILPGGLAASSSSGKSEAPSESKTKTLDKPSSAGSVSSAAEKSTAGCEEAAEKKLAGMSLGEKVGQIFIFECPSSGTVGSVKSYDPGGYCFSADDFKDKSADEVKKTLASYQNAAKTKMFLCCDEEGGTVVRVSCFPALSGEKFKSPQEVYAKGGMQAVTNDTVKKAVLLKSLGLNVNLAPVCDVSTDPSDFIYARSFGKDAQSTAAFVTASVQAYKSKNMSCVLKHFPGYGGSGDTHKGTVYDSRSMETFEKSDLLPFIAGINEGAPCVMVSHNIVKSMDEKSPASLSTAVHNVLREKLAFKGVIMTDDLSMGAVTKYEKGKNACVEAFNAGNDILLTGGSPAESFNAVYKAVKNGSISEERLDESVRRILLWKYEAGIITDG